MGNKSLQLVLRLRLQNELKSDVARFTTLESNCLATNQVVAGGEKLLRRAESSSTFCL